MASGGAAAVEEETHFLGNPTQSEPWTQGHPDAAVTPLLNGVILAASVHLLQEVPEGEGPLLIIHTDPIGTTLICECFQGKGLNYVVS